MTHQLVDALQVAVPMALDNLDTWPDDLRADVIERWRAAAVESLPYRADDVLYGTGLKSTQKRRDAAAATFGDLARGLAVLATAPGGVSFAGVLWCASHARWGRTAPHPCADCLAAEAGAA